MKNKERGDLFNCILNFKKLIFILFIMITKRKVIL